jgi:hypothetical protein
MSTMANTQNNTPQASKVLRIDTAGELRAAIEEVFDYRGDVTIKLSDGSEVIGYVYNRMFENVAEPYLDYYPRNAEQPKRVLLKDIRGLALTGADAAAGRSWETWTKKYQEKKKAQAEGRDIGNIEPEALPLND